jgi:hypothetical protein
MRNLDRRVLLDEIKAASEAGKFPPTLLKRIGAAKESIHDSFSYLRDLEAPLYSQLRILQRYCPHPARYIIWYSRPVDGCCKLCGLRVAETSKKGR